MFYSSCRCPCWTFRFRVSVLSQVWYSKEINFRSMHVSLLPLCWDVFIIHSTSLLSQVAPSVCVSPLRPCITLCLCSSVASIQCTVLYLNLCMYLVSRVSRGDTLGTVLRYRRYPGYSDTVPVIKLASPLNKAAPCRLNKSVTIGTGTCGDPA